MGDQAESVRLLTLYARRAPSRCIPQVTILFSPPKTGISLYESLSWHDQVCWLLARFLAMVVCVGVTRPIELEGVDCWVDDESHAPPRSDRIN